MQSHYEINVAKDGRHFFATAPRSARDEDEAAKLFAAIQQRFPESEGFSVSCTRWNCVGHKVFE